MLPHEIARVCHEANRAVQTIQASPLIAISPPWDELDFETRQSAISGVVNALKGATPEESHENWCRFKREHGWVRGPVKDLERREHPLLVPYDELPESQKLKDKLFLAVVEALREDI